MTVNTWGCERVDDNTFLLHQERFGRGPAGFILLLNLASSHVSAV